MDVLAKSETVTSERYGSGYFVSAIRDWSVRCDGLLFGASRKPIMVWRIRPCEFDGRPVGVAAIFEFLFDNFSIVICTIRESTS